MLPGKDHTALDLERVLGEEIDRCLQQPNLVVEAVAIESTISVEQLVVVDIHHIAVAPELRVLAPLVVVRIAASSTVAERFVVVFVRHTVVVESVVDESTTDIVLKTSPLTSPCDRQVVDTSVT